MKIQMNYLKFSYTDVEDCHLHLRMILQILQIVYHVVL